MTKTCIICGEAAGSHEHVFPAALGGRRTNKGIYCGEHNEGYSPLASILSQQFKAINAHLGVRGDHADEPHSIEAVDSASGRQIKLSADKIELAGPVVLSASTEGGRDILNMAFANQREIEEWIKAQRAKGFDVQIGAQAPNQQYFLSDTKVELVLGGVEGLRAIGYVAETFLAQHFPKIARAVQMNEFKAFTQGLRDGDHVWWDFGGQETMPPNAFKFGHRIVVGVDPATSSVYGRVSLFSALHFSVLFGKFLSKAAESFIVDIDPLADRPPDDIAVKKEGAAVATVTKPTPMTANLAEAIRGGGTQRLMTKLMERISDHRRTLRASEIMKQIEGAASMDSAAREKLFRSILEAESQRILNMMRHVVDNLKASKPMLAKMLPGLDEAVAADPKEANGLSKQATLALEVAREALLAAMLDEHSKGALDEDRAGMLIGGGPGAFIVGNAILAPIISSLPE
jgi:hypothetical protein